MRPLAAAEERLLDEARTAVMATLDPAGRPRLVPICFVSRGASDGAGPPVIYSSIDDKPKSTTDPHRLARVRDIAARPEVSLLVQRWDEDWSRLGWLRMYGTAELVEPDDSSAATERADAIAGLRARYPQYVGHDLEARPLIRIQITEATSWLATADEPEPTAHEPDRRR